MNTRCVPLLSAAACAALSRGRRENPCLMRRERTCSPFPRPHRGGASRSHAATPQNCLSSLPGKYRLSRGQTKQPWVVAEAVVTTSARYLHSVEQPEYLIFTSWFVVLSSYFLFSGNSGPCQPTHNFFLVSSYVVPYSFSFCVCFTSLYHLVSCLVDVCYVRGPGG